jgi:hypothetical protein
MDGVGILFPVANRRRPFCGLLRTNRASIRKAQQLLWAPATSALRV